MYYKANILFSLNNIRAYLVHAYKKYSQINFFLYLPVHFWLKNLAKLHVGLTTSRAICESSATLFPCRKGGAVPSTESGRTRFTGPVKLGVTGAGETDLKIEHKTTCTST